MTRIVLKNSEVAPNSNQLVSGLGSAKRR